MTNVGDQFSGFNLISGDSTFSIEYISNGSWTTGAIMQGRAKSGSELTFKTTDEFGIGNGDRIIDVKAQADCNDEGNNCTNEVDDYFYVY